jgi:hypothetical protein
MSDNLILIDQDALLEELQRVFDLNTSRTVLRVLNKAATQIVDRVARREDLNGLRQIVAELVEAQKRTEQQVGELVEAQKRTEQRLDQIGVALQELVEVQRHTDQHVRELARSQQRLWDKFSTTEKFVLEYEYRQKAVSYFGKLVRRPQPLSQQETWDLLVDKLSDAELEDALNLDIVIRGRSYPPAAVPETWLGVEVSRVVDSHDVERARRRTALLRRAGLHALPVAAGKELTEDARTQAEAAGVAVLSEGSCGQDGAVLFLEEALKGNRRTDPITSSSYYKFAFTCSAAARVMPGTAASSSTDAWRMASSELKCLSNACRRRGPMPGISSNVEVKVDFWRRERWWVMANRCASSRMRCTR